MEPAEVKTTLSQLHLQLQNGDPLDPEIVALVQQLSADVNQILAGSATSHEVVEAAAQQRSRQSVTDRLLGLTEEFEESHPQLAEAIGRVATALSRIGI